jgi:hypothetical protein
MVRVVERGDQKLDNVPRKAAMDGNWTAYQSSCPGFESQPAHHNT